jgi:hypothetical protein
MGAPLLMAHIWDAVKNTWIEVSGDTSGNPVLVGPVVPARLRKGLAWLDTSGASGVLRICDGKDWVSFASADIPLGVIEPDTPVGPGPPPGYTST